MIPLVTALIQDLEAIILDCAPNPARHGLRQESSSQAAFRVDHAEDKRQTMPSVTMAILTNRICSS
jgi:hypothetical protein